MQDDVGDIAIISSFSRVLVINTDFGQDEGKGMTREKDG